LEKDILIENIFGISQTPNITFEKLQGTGNVAGVALEMMFMDAKLNAKEQEEEFGDGIQRRINIMKKGISILNTGLNTDVEIYPEFKFYLPKNQEEEIRILSVSTGNRQILSQKSAVQQNPYVENPEQELEQIKSEEAGQFGNFFPETPNPI
jgi:SPP1 family phage portal protein